MDEYRELFLKIKKQTLFIIARALRYFVLMLIVPLTTYFLSDTVSKATQNTENGDLAFPITVTLFFVIFFAWQTVFVYHDNTVKREYAKRIKDNKYSDSFADAFFFNLKSSCLYIDLSVLFLHLMLFGSVYRPVAVLLDEKSAAFYSGLFSSLLIALFLPSVLILVILRSLRLYNYAPYIESSNLEDETNKRRIFRFSKNILSWGIVFNLGPIVAVFFITVLSIILKLALNYVKYILIAVAVYYVYALVRATVKRSKLRKKLTAVCERNDAKLEKKFFAYIPNVFFPAHVYRVTKYGKKYDVYAITVLSPRTLIRFFPGCKYCYGIKDISEITRREIGIPVTPKFKIRFKEQLGENTENIILINPSTKYLDIKEYGKVQRVIDLDVIYGNQVLSGSSLVQSMDRVLREVHDFSGIGKFKY